MLTGVANVFALSIEPFKRFDYAVIESDEAYLTKLYDYMKSDYLVVTNLFRDQLDRYGELSTTAGFIKNAIDKNQDLKLILNADDPIVATFNTTKYTVFMGLKKLSTIAATNIIQMLRQKFLTVHAGKNLNIQNSFLHSRGTTIVQNAAINGTNAIIPQM